MTDAIGTPADGLPKEYFYHIADTEFQIHIYKLQSQLAPIAETDELLAVQTLDLPAELLEGTWQQYGSTFC